MKEAIEEKVEIELEKKKRLPKEIKDKMNLIVFKNLAIAIAVVIYFIFINLGYFNIAKEVYAIDIKVFSMVILIFAIILFERAYKKDSRSYSNIWNRDVSFSNINSIYSIYILLSGTMAI